MKKNFLFATLLMLVLACFTNCKKDSAINVNADDLVGKWLLTHYHITYSYPDQVSPIDYPDPGVIYNFKEDGTLIATSDGEPIFEDTWTLSGSTLYMRELNSDILLDGGNQPWAFLQFGNGTMSVTTSKNNGSYSEVYIYYFSKMNSSVE